MNTNLPKYATHCEPYAVHDALKQIHIAAGLSERARGKWPEHHFFAAIALHSGPLSNYLFMENICMCASETMETGCCN